MTDDISSLPACQFRGRVLDGGMVECDCDHIGSQVLGIVPASVCLAPCSFRDEAIAQAKHQTFPPGHPLQNIKFVMPGRRSRKQKSLSLFQKATNYIRSLTSHALSGFPQTPEPDYIERLTICESCDRRKPNSWECMECGCPMDEKAAWAEQECALKEPLKKWRKVDPQTPRSAGPAPGCGTCG